MDTFAEKAKNWDNPVKIAMTTAFVDAIEERNIPIEGQTVLEIGCGTGLVGLEFADRAERLIMVDTSQAMLEVLHDKVAKLNADNIAIVHGDISQVEQKADVILSFMALHHIADTETFLAEVKARLNENGIVVIGDLYAEDGSFHPEEESVPHNGFDPANLIREFEKVGFREVSIAPLTTVERRGKVYELFILTAKKG